MNEFEKCDAQTTEQSVAAENANPQPNAAVAARQRQEARRWWIKRFVQPALLRAGGVILIIGLFQSALYLPRHEA